MATVVPVMQSVDRVAAAAAVVVVVVVVVVVGVGVGVGVGVVGVGVVRTFLWKLHRHVAWVTGGSKDTCDVEAARGTCKHTLPM